MKKLVGLLISIAAGGAFANNTLDSFSEVQDAINSGKSIHAIFNFAKCDNAQGANLQFYLSPQNIKLYPKAINFNAETLVLNNPNYSGIPVYEYTQYIIDTDDSIEIWGNILNATKTKVLTKVNKPIVCKIGKGVRLFD